MASQSTLLAKVTYAGPKLYALATRLYRVARSQHLTKFTISQSHIFFIELGRTTAHLTNLWIS